MYALILKCKTVKILKNITKTFYFAEWLMSLLTSFLLSSSYTMKVAIKIKMKSDLIFVNVNNVNVKIGLS